MSIETGFVTSDTGESPFLQMLATVTPVTREAHDLVRGDRQEDYGTPEQNFDRIAQFWTIHLGERLEHELTRHDVCLMMQLVKLARQSDGYHHDSQADTCGYAELDQRFHEHPGRWTGSPS